MVPDGFGVTEVRMSDVGLGERELRAALAAHAGGSAQELVTEIARRAVELQSGTPRDDIALLAIKGRGTSPHRATVTA